MLCIAYNVNVILQVVDVGGMEAMVVVERITVVEWRTHTKGLTAAATQVSKICDEWHLKN